MSALPTGLRVRRLTVTPSAARPGAWISRDEKDEARFHPDAADVVRFVRRRDRVAAASGSSTATIVEWNDVPPGFEAPS